MAVNGKDEPPPALQMAWFCGDNHLPAAGGIFDQEYKLMVHMRTLQNTYNAVAKMRSLRGKEINTGLSTNERLLLGELQKMGIPLGGLG